MIPRKGCYYCLVSQFYIIIFNFTYRHVWFATGIYGFGNRVHQITTNAEIAHLDLSFPIQQNVRRFHVSVYHFQLRVKIM